MPRRYKQGADGQPHPAFYGKLPEEFSKADTMRFMVETDLKLSGCVSADTLAALRAEGYDYKDGNLVPAGKEETMQEKVANTTPAAPLKLDVSVRVIEPVKNLMGFASVKFNDCFVVENLKIVQGSKGLFLGMPSQPDGKGGYRDMAYPVTKEFREQLNTAVLQAYEAKLGTTWGAASYLQILASELSDKLLAELLEMDAEMTITLHIQTVDQAAAVKSIKAKVSDIDKMKVEEQKKAARSGYDMDILPPDLVTYSNDAKTLLEDLQSRNERMFLLTFLVVNMAPTRRELDNDLFTVSGIVQKYNCTLKRLDFQQEDGFLSSLPLGHNGIEIKRGMTTSSTAIFVPFMTQELRMDGEAVYYGLNALSHNVIMANRKKLKNPNGLFLGVPGSGKSFAAKRELVNVFLATRDRIIVVDPMGEYSPLIKRLGGQVIEIAPDSPHHINPMDIDLSFDEENPMALKADFILSLMELIVGGKDGLQPVERTVIDRCVRQMYREHLQDPETSKMPTLQTLYDLLCSQPEGEAVRLATALEIYVSGSLNVFNHETNVDLNRRLVCLDLKKLGAGLRTIAMLIMQDLVNSQVSMNFLRGIATWCYFDEFHVLLRDRLTASYCVAIWKMLRKKGCVPSALTQNVKDFLASPEIENIFENSDFLVLLSQAQGDRQILAKQLGISPHQLSYVTHTNSGEGLLFFGNTTIPFVDRFPQNTELYAIMTTRPEDKKQKMNRA